MPLSFQEVTTKGDANNAMVDLAAYAYYLASPRFNATFVSEGGTALKRFEVAQLANSACISIFNIDEIDNWKIQVMTDASDTCE